MLKKLQSSAVITEEVEQEDRSTVTLTNCEEIEAACIQEHLSKYSQTNNTVCVQETMRSLLGKTDHIAFTESILEGTPTFSPDIPEHTKDFFAQMKYNPQSCRN